jgi:hypothetical protein
MHISLDLSLPVILIIVTGALAVIDSLVSVRGRRGLLGIIELIAGVLLILSTFIVLPHILGRTIMQVVLEVVLILMLLLRRGRRGGIAITIITLVLNTVLILLALHWIEIPGLSLK